MWRLILMIVLTVSAGIGAALLYGSVRWRQRTNELRARLHAARAPVTSRTYDSRELDQLPPVVQRYFRTALTEGQRIIETARFTHTGTFNMSETDEQWRPFSVWACSAGDLEGLPVCRNKHVSFVVFEKQPGRLPRALDMSGTIDSAACVS